MTPTSRFDSSPVYRRLDTRRGDTRRGFTAVEMIAVATVIAVLALILIPVIGNRVEKARQTAAREDLLSISKAVTLAQADASHYFRLQDYDNTTAYTADTSSVDFDPSIEVPVTYWDRLAYLSESERATLKGKWEGRYLTFTKTISIQELYDSAAYGFACTRIDPDTSGFDPNGDATKRGPIIIFTPSSDTDPRYEYNETHMYPVDPWGAPYLFFAPGALMSASVTIYSEANFHTPVAISLGPDGNPGNKEPTASTDFLRTSTDLGTGDDIVLEF